jgi:hypothetical protein
VSTHIDYARLLHAAQALGELVDGAGEISLADVDDTLTEVAGIVGYARQCVALDVAHLQAMIGG